MKFTDLKIRITNVHYKRIFILAFTVLITQCLWILLSDSRYRVGFPLDDAWIHQTYARNFVENFRWEYNSNQISGGSTSPLWTILLMPGYLFKGNFYLIWTYFLGFLLTVSCAYIFEEILCRLTNKTNSFPFYGLLFILEWHILWGANSGMETILFIFVILLTTHLIINDKIYSFIFAILMGILIWVRPDAITLIVIPLFAFFEDWLVNRTINKKIFVSVIVFGLSVVVYFGFNKLVSGSFFPNTFYAKQAEYSILYQQPILTRILNILIVPITGVGSILLPGFLYQIVRIIKERIFILTGILLWFFGYILLFAIRLPVTYQHGRYFIPIIPIYLVIAVLGFNSIVKRMINRPELIIMKSWKISIVIVLFIFWGLGANAFSEDVSIIESEMVDTAIWINENTSYDSKISAHDIGALGFFTNREIVDLAGLISPDVIPFINDESALKTYLDNQDVDYLMIFPNWYVNLVDGKQLIYQGEKPFTILAGGEHMAVFKWKE